MSQNEKKRRKAFLNDLCRKFGITPKDRRRSEAAIAFIAYGEIRCRAWLAQAGSDFAGWEKKFDIKEASKKVSKLQAERKNVSPKASPKIRGGKTELPKFAHKVGGRMNVRNVRYSVGPDGVVGSW